jgi:DMSO/TMAO reductase YedYZ molybdopterin-dependent catalytic subunit
MTANPTLQQSASDAVTSDAVLTETAPTLDVITAFPYNAETPVAAFTDRRTHQQSLFVRNHFGIPKLDADTWRLRISGAVDAPASVSYRELLSLPTKQFDVVLECAGNRRAGLSPRPLGLPWGDRAAGCVRFAGVRFRDVLGYAGLRASASEIVFSGADVGELNGRPAAFARSLPVPVALHPDTLLSTHINGVSLTPEHGAPVRLLVPGWYGVASVKWLIEASAVTEPFRGVLQTDHYVYRDSQGSPDEPVTTMRVSSVITSPTSGAVLPGAGGALVSGWAWSGTAPVNRVDVSLDDDAHWHPAALVPPRGRYAWTGWSFRCPPMHAGQHRVQVRATDEHGNTQPTTAPWNALGYGNNAIATIEITAV